MSSSLQVLVHPECTFFFIRKLGFTVEKVKEGNSGNFIFDFFFVERKMCFSL